MLWYVDFFLNFLLTNLFSRILYFAFSRFYSTSRWFFFRDVPISLMYWYKRRSKFNIFATTYIELFFYSRKLVGLQYIIRSICDYFLTIYSQNDCKPCFFLHVLVLFLNQSNATKVKIVNFWLNLNFVTSKNILKFEKCQQNCLQLVPRKRLKLQFSYQSRTITPERNTENI